MKRQIFAASLFFTCFAGTVGASTDLKVFDGQTTFVEEPFACYFIDEPNPTHEYKPFAQNSGNIEGFETLYYEIDEDIYKVVRYDFEEICFYDPIRK